MTMTMGWRTCSMWSGRTIARKKSSRRMRRSLREKLWGRRTPTTATSGWRGAGMAGDFAEYRAAGPYGLASRARAGARKLVVAEAGGAYRAEDQTNAESADRSGLRVAADGRCRDGVRGLDAGVAGAA